MKPDDILTLDIKNIGADGDGIATLGRSTVYVSNALPGERVRAIVTEVAKTYARAEIDKVFRFSKYSVMPFCQHFSECGGCQIQRLNYREQLLLKRKIVVDNLAAAGVSGPEIVSPTIGCKVQTSFRNKAIFPIGKNNRGKIVAGFYERGSHDIVPTKFCVVGAPENIPIVSVIIEHLSHYNIPPYDEATCLGLVRYVLIRKAFETNSILVSIVVTDKNLPFENELVANLLNVSKAIKSISLSINGDHSNRIRGTEVVNLFGDGYITEMMDGIKFRISPLSFFQVNTSQAIVLYRKVLEMAELTGNETVFDLYCGIGTITLFLARRASKVFGVETVPQAVEDARENARINNVTNVEFYEGNAEDVVPNLVNQKGLKADVVVVDPPRKGCDMVLLDTIIKMRPKRLIYVSCDSKSLARDLVFLENNGYKTKHVQPVDMFPHTVHVESVALITL